MSRDLVTLADIEAARLRIEGRLHRTPLLRSTSLGRMFGVDLWLKAELFQKTGSFKPRGVFNKLLALSRNDMANGLVSISAGNHAAALAHVARAVGTTATIVMPTEALRSKIEATRAYGGEVVLTDGDLLEECRRIQAARGSTMVHPFDDPAVIAGQGTVGLEMVEDLPKVEIVVVPVGGGGLVSGIAAAVKARRPEVKVVGVEPERSNAMSRSIRAGRPVAIGHPATVADGLNAPFAGDHTLRHVQALVDDVVTVSDEDIVASLRLVMQRTKLAAEPSGVAAVAGLLAGVVRPRAGAAVVCVVSGGNFDVERLKQIL
jgi:threonine dehydratase